MEQEYPEMDIEEFIEGCAKRFCPMCGVAIVQKRRGRKKKFCSDKCRWAFHKRKKRKVPWEVKLLEDGVDVYRHF
jgi:predicted nucleic acid-binding Zn ribbon protein